MKSKAPLVMMEQIIMVLVFALAAALCLQTFVLSGKLSKRTEAQGRAAIEAQNAAESMKAHGLGSYVKEAEQTANGYRFFFDAGWNKVSVSDEAAYYLEVCPVNEDNEYIWKAEIIVKEPDGTELFSISAAGQTEVTRYE